TKYYDANFRHFSELLEKHEQITVSPSCVSTILESEYILSPQVTKAQKKRTKQEFEDKKKAAKNQKEANTIQANLVAIEDAHSRRPRCTYFGEM
ncbi:MAG: transposase, partial [Lachnospiraceae bacterium]|nr:transposase [Lachnospiraceae bacterium]